LRILTFQKEVDDFLMPFTIRHSVSGTLNETLESPDIGKEQITQVDRIRSIFEQFVFGHYSISFEDFRPILRIQDRETFVKELGDKFKIKRADAKKLYDSILEASTQNLF
jgi:hypothetical protein